MEATCETTAKQGDSELENLPKRNHIIQKLGEICSQLEAWALSKKPVLPIRVKLFRAAIYGYSVQLSALKDQELELRVRDLEEKVRGGVVIPNDFKKKA